MSTKPSTLENDLRLRVNRAFGKMRFGSMCNFTSITKDDSEADTLAKIAGNIERLGEYLVAVSDKAAENERTLGNHKDMFRALGELVEEVIATRAK
jgi:hypothetical protein